jgi:hypothetical protein
MNLGVPFDTHSTQQVLTSLTTQITTASGVLGKGISSNWSETQEKTQ